MSFSFQVIGASKADVRDGLAKQFEHLKTHQPAHVEAGLVRALSDAYIEFLAEPPIGRSLRVTVSGSIGGQWHSETDTFDPVTGLQLSINASVFNE